MNAVSGRGLAACSLRRRLLVILAAFTCCWRVCLTCPKPCACYVPTEIHCTFRYLNAIPENIQAHVERINLGYNNLMKLTSESFAGLKSLELLMLHSNKIQEIPDNTFNDLQSLQVLKMSYNKVKSLNRETFHGLCNIVRLHMDHNNIEFINPEAFYGLTSLKLLHLEGNMLQELHRDTFVTFRFSQIFKVSSIKHLYLSDNALTSIPSDLLFYSSEIESIYLHGNKWFCDCNLKWLAELNERLPGVIKCKRDRNDPNGQMCPLCANPSASKGKDILQLPSSVFACTPPKIQSPLKMRNSVMEEEGDYAVVYAKDFVAPLGQMSLNMSDQSGNGCEITCNVHRPLRTPGVTLEQKEDHVLLNTSLSTFLICYIDYEKIQRLWGILAMYTDSPLKLERNTLLSKTPSMSYLYKQSSNMDMQLYTGIQAEIKAEPAWLLQSEITLQMDRTRTTLNVLQIKYLIDVEITLQDLEVKPGKNSWVMIKRANSVRTEHLVVMGGTVDLECEAFGDPKPINEWILPDGSKVRAPYNSEDSRISVSADGKFTLRLADLYDSGIYHCIGTNYQDADVLSFRVTILDPNVSEKDINGPYISKSSGDSLHLPCQASGIPNASVRWVLPDHRVLDHTANNKEITSNGTLRIKKLTVRNGGYYRCVASNRYGVDLLALQVTVTGSSVSSEKESVENNEATEDGLGSGESEEELLESEEVEVNHGQLATGNRPVHKSDHPSTSAPETHPVTPRRRTSGSGARTRWWPNRRTLKQPRRRIDPQRWAEYLEKARKNTLAKTATGGTTVQPQPSPDEGETSGDEPRGAVEEEFIMVTTLRPRTASIPRVSPKIPRGKETPVGAQSPMPVLTLEPGAKGATTPIRKVPTEPNVHPVTTYSIYNGKPGSVKGQTTTPHQPIAEAQLTPSAETSGPHFIPTPTPAALVTNTPEKAMNPSEEHTTGMALAEGEAMTIHGYHARNMTITTTKDDGDQVLLKTTQKLTTPRPHLLSTIIAQQAHVIKESTTDISVVSKPRQLGRRRKLPYRRRIGRPGVRRHRYSIVRPGQRRPAGSTLTQLHRTSSATEVPERPSLPPPVPTPPGAGMRRVQGPGDPAEPAVELDRVVVQKDTDSVSVPEVTLTHWEERSHRMISPESGTRIPAPKFATQPPDASPNASPITNLRPTERPGEISFASPSTPTTVQPTSKAPKTARGKIPWDRLFGVNSQRDVLRRLRKPEQGTRTKIGTHGIFILTKPTLDSVGTSALTGDPIPFPFSTARSQSTTTEPTTRLPATFTTSTALPAAVRTVPVTAQTVPTTPIITQPTLTTRRTFFRRRRPGKPFSRTRNRVSARPNAGRNRSAAESRKARPAKARMISLSPTTPLTTKVSLPVTVETSTWNPVTEWKQFPKTIVRTPTTSAGPYGSKLLAVSSNSPPSQPNATRQITLPSPIAETAGIITTTGLPSAATKANRLPRIRNRIRPRKTTTIPPTTQSRGPSTTIVPITQPRAHPTTVVATSARSLSTFQPTSRAIPKFRITLHKFDTSAPRRRPPAFRVDRPGWENPHSWIFRTSQAVSRQTPLSSAEAPIQYRATTPTASMDLGNTIEGEGSREDLSNEIDPSSPNVIAVDPMVGNPLSKPSIHGGTAASLTVLAESDAFVPCDATGNPLPTIRWTKISTGATITASAKRGNKFEVFPNGTLSIQKIKVQDRGQYLCTAENQLGSARLLVTLSVVAHPSKILEPRIKDITVHSGYPVEMKCRSQGRPFPTISWILSNRTMVRNSSPFNGRVSVLADGTLRIKAVTVYDRGNYRCVASNPAGIDTVTVRMQVLAQPPTILEEKRQSIKLQAGENIRLPCTAVGTPQPNVRWLVFDGTEVKPLQFVNMKLFVFTNGTLYVKSLTPADSGDYECVATSSSGSEKRVVSLMVERKQELPKILAALPSRNKLNYGDKLQIHCSATGDPKPQILWRLPSKILVDQWYRRGGRVVVLFNGTLSIDSITEKDAGEYMCIARNKVGDDLMSVKIDVSLKPALIEHNQSIHKHVSYGGDLQVDCKASGAPKPEISWSLPDGTMVNNVLQADDSGRRTRRYVVFGNGTLYYNKVGMAEEGDYTCYAQNTLGKDEMKVHVTVVAAAPRIKNSHKPFHKARVGESAVFDCQAVGKPLPKISWMLPTNEIISFSKSRYHLHSNGSLLIKSIRFSDAGEYMCIARNPGGDDTDLFHLSVALIPPAINGFHGNRTVIQDTAVKHTRKLIDCRAEGVPTPRITWIMPDNILLNAPYYGSRIIVHINGTLEIRNVRASDKAEFTCVARSEAGEATLVVNLDVTQMLRRPVFKNPFNEKFIASAESTAVLNCSADGHPPPEIIWILPNGTRFSSRHKAARLQMGSSGTFLIRSPTAADAGKYRCAARNKVGYIEKLIILEVGQKPIIDTRPLGLVRSMSGDVLRLHCSASGRPMPAIAWTVPSGFVLDRPQINAKYILFENGTLIIREISTHDRGNYICKARNNAGVSSLVIPVMVIAYAPRITNGPPKSIQARAGSPVQLNCMAIGIPKPEIVWELPNHTVLSTFSKARPVGREYLHPQGTLAIQRVSVHDSGSYKCTARSRLGSDSRVTFIQVV